MAYDTSRFPQTAPIDETVKITSELHDPRTLEIASCKKKEVT